MTETVVQEESITALKAVRVAHLDSPKRRMLHILRADCVCPFALC
jgi:hypothetical protein